MKIEINAASRLKATQLVAKFTPPQVAEAEKILALWSHLKFDTYNFIFNFRDNQQDRKTHAFWNQKIGNVELYNVVSGQSHTLRYICKAIVDSGKDDEDEYASTLLEFFGPRARRGVGLKNLDTLIKAYTILLKSKPSGKHTVPGTYVFVEGLLKVMPLLNSSWAYICKKLKEDYDEMSDRHHLNVDWETDPKAGQAAVLTEMKKLESKGFKLSEVSGDPLGVDPYYLNKNKGWMAASPDLVLVYNPGGGFISVGGSIKPYFKLDASDPQWYTYERSGIDDGSSGLTYGHIGSTIKGCITRVQKTREATAHRKANGATFNFGPTARNVLPQEMEKYVGILQQGRSFDLTPSGFGTGYRFSTRRFSYDKPASKELTQKVGKPVYYTEFDHD